MNRIIICTIVIIILVALGCFFIVNNREKNVSKPQKPVNIPKIVEKIEINNYSQVELENLCGIDFSDANRFVFSSPNLFDDGNSQYYGINFMIKEDGMSLYYDDNGLERTLDTCAVTFEPGLGNETIKVFKGNDMNCFVITNGGRLYRAKVEYDSNIDKKITFPFRQVSNTKNVAHVCPFTENINYVKFEDETLGLVEIDSNTIRDISTSSLYDDALYRLLDGSYQFIKVCDEHGNEKSLEDYDISGINYIFFGGLSSIGVDNEYGLRGFMINFERMTSFYQFIEKATVMPFQESEEINIDYDKKIITLSSCEDFDYITYEVGKIANGDISVTMAIHGKEGFFVYATRTQPINSFRTNYEYENNVVIEGFE